MGADVHVNIIFLTSLVGFLTVYSSLFYSDKPLGWPSGNTVRNVFLSAKPTGKDRLSTLWTPVGKILRFSVFPVFGRQESADFW